MYFNPRSREGSDLFFDSSARRMNISIRAPARGATHTRSMALLINSNFNPRSREGSDAPSRDLSENRRIFQSALPRGERPPGARTLDTLIKNFNPRSREGSDLDCLPGGSDQPISIRAPARGATELLIDQYPNLKFQSALPRGERHQFSPKNSLLS